MALFLEGKHSSRKSSQMGMTLIEVLLVLVLLLVVLTPAVNALSSGSRTWIHTSAVNPRIAEANTAMAWLSRDIRGASSPSVDAPAVAVAEEGQQLLLYCYNEDVPAWQKVVYQVSDNKLRRIVLSDPDPDDPQKTIALSVPSTGNPCWTTLLEGVAASAASQVFVKEEGSRSVEINLQIEDPGSDPRFEPFTVASAYTVRSSEIGAITGDPVIVVAEPPEIPAESATISKDKITLVIDTSSGGSRSGVISARVWPTNATDKSVTWTCSDTAEEWIKLSPSGLNAAVEVVETRKIENYGWWDRFLLNVSPEEFTVTVAPAAGGEADTCTIAIKGN